MILNDNMTEGGFADPRFLFATLDGEPLVFETPWVRVVSPTFEINVGENDPFFPPGTSDDEAVSDGYWLLIPPLSPGEHELAFGGQILLDLDEDGAAETPVFEVNLVYHLTVTRGRGRR